MERITVSDKEYMKMRVNEEYNPLLQRMKDLLIPVREKIRAEVRKSLGIVKVEAEIEKLKAQLADLERQHEEVVGKNYGGLGATNTPFSREVERRLMKHPEAKALQRVKESFKESKDKIALAGIPTELKDVLKDLPKKLAPLLKEVKELEAA